MCIFVFKTGDVVFYDNVESRVLFTSRGEDGERVTIKRGQSEITTTPGLDPRFTVSQLPDEES